MKGVVADLVPGTHSENGLPGGLDGSTMDFGVCGARASRCVRIRTFVCQTCREFPPYEFRDR